MKRIVLTGGGTAGHVTPNLALIPALQAQGFDVHYIGTRDGMEKSLIQKANIPYHVIAAGKLRRYVDMKNITDIAKIIQGTCQAVAVLLKIKPNVVFAKGGFVSCPVVWAAKVLGIPVVVHESDLTPGLANKLSLPFAKKICYTFPETALHLDASKSVLTGLPIRTALAQGDAVIGRKLCGFTDEKPVLLVMGGSQGASVLNQIIRSNLHTLLNDYQICHLCGKDNQDSTLEGLSGYCQFAYAHEELAHLFAMTDLFLSRAGSTAIHEMLLVNKPMLLIPLSKNASRGDQILNAISFENRGFASMIFEEDLDDQLLIGRLSQIQFERSRYIKAIKTANIANGLDATMQVILSVLK
ncbi:MAG: undecaprenyldiphospho-muramoylpentapeptide beta-N-acetylglucosaminyltransferase [Hyphomonadaceae bacterium]|nr:undecaprenyldiphospho-muramoylpentapeptide beta-N-acetylglucosaminyltransferase [Clostridia bacterium]